MVAPNGLTIKAAAEVRNEPPTVAMVEQARRAGGALRCLRFMFSAGRAGGVGAAFCAGN